MEVKKLDPLDFEKYDALIFDCDGTLVDTMPTHFESWVATLNQYDIPFDHDRFYGLAGVPTVDIVALLAKEYGRTLDATKVAQEKDKHFHDNLSSLQPIQEVVDIAKYYLNTKKLAVASGSTRWSVDELLKSVGIDTWFPVISAAEDVKNPKPAPDVFLNAAKLLGVEPSKCCVFEDAELGMQGAIAAGMDAVNIVEK